MDNDLKENHGYLKLAGLLDNIVVEPMGRLYDFVDRVHSSSRPNLMRKCSGLFVLLALWTLDLLSILFIAIILGLYFMLTVYMESIFLLFTVLIAYYQVPRMAFYVYLSALLVGLFLTWLNCDPAHFSKIVFMQFLCWSRLSHLKPLIKLLDCFGKFRSSCPVDGLPRTASSVMIFSRKLQLTPVHAVVKQSVLEKDAPGDFYSTAGMDFQIARSNRGTATISFWTDYDYFMKEFDWDEKKLGVVSAVFRRMFVDRMPIGSFFRRSPTTLNGFRHMSVGAIINKVMSGEEVHICELKDGFSVTTV